MSVPIKEFRQRLERFQKALQALELDGALITHMTGLFYLTGTGQNCHFFVPAAGNPLLMAYKDVDRAREENVWENFLPIGSLKEIPELIREAGFTGLKRLGLEMDVLSWKMGMTYKKLFPGVCFEDVSMTLRRLRMVKSEYELEAMRFSAVNHAQVFRHICDYIRPGMTELEIAVEFESFARSQGEQGTVRFRCAEQGMRVGLVLSGPNSALTSCYDTPLDGQGLSPLYPRGAGYRTWERGEPLLIDYAAVYGEYLVDVTRVYISDPAPPKLTNALEVAAEIAAAVAQAAKPGAVTGELYDMAVTMAAKAGLGDHFMGQGRQAPYIGHGIGLEVNELPVLAKGDKTVLEAGMTFAMEPKFVFRGLGGAGTEDTYIVTEEGARPLTR